jgi:hypothetical protein
MDYRARARAQGNAIQCYTRVGPSAGVGIRVVDPSLPKVGAVCGKGRSYGSVRGRSAMSVPAAIAPGCCSGYVCLWQHLADMADPAHDVRSRG